MLKRIIVMILFFWSAGAFASSPFLEGDFVSVSGLPSIEVLKHEVTYGQWNALNSELPEESRTPWKAKDCFPYIGKGHDGPNYPVACVSFKDIQAFLQVLNDNDQIYFYRLPNAVELGMLVDTSLDFLRVNGDVSDNRLSRHAWYFPHSDSHAHKVCTKKPIFGLCDILGNVEEWTNTPVNFKEPWDYSRRTIIGASFYSYIYTVLPADRRSSLLENRYEALGFRVVRSPLQYGTMK